MVLVISPSGFSIAKVHDSTACITPYHPVQLLQIHACMTVTIFCCIFLHAGGRIGTIETLQHDVSGTLYFIDSRTIFIDNFNYDGQGPGRT